MPNIKDIIDPSLIDDNLLINDDGGLDLPGSYPGMIISRVQVGDDLYEIGDYIVNGQGEILGKK